MKRKLKGTSGEDNETDGLPPFENLELYAATAAKARAKAKSPERFYLEPRQGGYSDWSVATKGKALPVHSALLGLSCKFFDGLLNDGIKPTGPIDLPIPEMPKAQVLAFLRFIYDVDSLNENNILHLRRHGNLIGVLRLAHCLDCQKVFERCKRIVKDSVDAGPPAEGDEENSIRFQLDTVRDLRDFAVDIKDEDLQEACYTYVAKWCYQITWQNEDNSEPATFEDSVALVNALSDCPDLLKAGLFAMLYRDSNVTGKTIQRTFDDVDYLPEALFTFKYQLSDGYIKRFFTEIKISSESYWLSPEDDESHARLEWNGHRYQMEIELYNGDNDGKCLLQIDTTLEIPTDQPGPKVEMTFCFLNWADPAKSIRKKNTYNFPCDTITTFTTILSEDPSFIHSCLDERGCLYILLEDIKVIGVEAPGAINDDYNEYGIEI